MIERWHIPIMGFTQRNDQLTGMEKLWRRLRRNAVSRTSSLIHPQRWRADWSGLAEFIWRNSAQDPVVRIYAYSWGAGHGFVRLAKHLGDRGVLVDHAVLSDPVYHHWLRPWRGLFAGSWNPPIVVPRNVREVDWFFQRENTPQAAHVVAADASLTRVHDGRLLMRTHQYMDDADEFHTLVEQVAVQ